MRIGEGGHCGAWRLLCAAPAVLTSAMFVTFAFSWLGAFTLVGSAAWLLAGVSLSLPWLSA